MNKTLLNSYDSFVSFVDAHTGIIPWLESLPEGLKGAAEQYADKNCHNYVENESDRNELLYAFKAGAEWMAGQGVTCGGRIMKSSTGETYAESDYVPLDGKCGDKVIVQIRKK